ANGIECTFSDGNIFVENILNDCNHGVWAGYSYNTVIAGNRIGDCANGVSIEHGRNNLIAGNFLANCDLGVHLWWDNDVDLLESPFGKRHPNCPSSDNRILGNTFTHSKTAVRLGDDTNTVIRWNTMDGVETAVDLIGRLDGARITNNDLGGGAIRNAATGTDTISPNTDAGTYEAPREMTELAARLPPRTKGSQHAYLPGDHPRGRRYIFVDEWGPYDFSDLRVFPARVVGTARATFQILGPAGAFKVDRVTGDVEVQPLSGELPGTITVSATRNGWQPFRVHITADRRKLEAVGGLLKADWTVKFYRWDPADDPRADQDKWNELIAQAPLEERTLPAIDFVWGGRAPSANVPRDHFGTVATTTVNLPAGTWVVRTISDDGIRVWVDGRRIIDDWTWHPPKENVAEIELADGTHAIRVEHFEIDGFAQLQLRLEPAR
ncbi:MAG: right-handed parallel beta-helix repeat-containing protein, partial [Planctomycetes bacterium]|nr:right-handed parallel beta-helix repeat-containing protein [Planctomycetota bacterium]